jgi:hypothetical protein
MQCTCAHANVPVMTKEREKTERQREKKMFKAIFLSFSSFIPFLLIFPTNSLFAFSNVIFSLLFSLSLSYFFISLSLSLFLRNTIDWSNATCKSDLALASCVLDKRHKLMSLSLSSLYSPLSSLSLSCTNLCSARLLSIFFSRSTLNGDFYIYLTNNHLSLSLSNRKP